MPKLFSVIGGVLAILTLAVTIRGIGETTKHYRIATPPPHIAFMRETGDAQTLYLTNPLDMNIRLQSVLPQLVSWKTHPYKDVEVLERYRRYLLAKRVFKGKDIDCTALDEAIETYGVTHLLLDNPEKMVSCVGSTAVFASGQTRIYRLSH